MLSNVLSNFIAHGTLRDGILSVPNVPTEGMLIFKKRLIYDLVNCRIPHFKVIGVEVNRKVVSPVEETMMMPTGVGDTYIELGSKFNSLVFPHSERWNNRVNMSDIVNTNGEGIYYEGNPNENIPTLLQNKFILDATRDVSLIRVITYKGTGDFDYKTSQNILYHIYSHDVVRSRKYKPIRVNFDLTQFILIRPVGSDDNVIEFVYKQDINEEVLMGILVNYAESVIKSIESKKAKEEEKE